MHFVLGKTILLGKKKTGWGKLFWLFHFCPELLKPPPLISEKYTNVVSEHTQCCQKARDWVYFSLVQFSCSPSEWLPPFSMEAQILTALILLPGRRNSPMAPRVLLYTEPCWAQLRLKVQCAQSSVSFHTAQLVLQEFNVVWDTLAETINQCQYPSYPTCNIYTWCIKDMTHVKLYHYFGNTPERDW